MSSPGATELLIVLVFVLLILGPKRLPSLGRQLGGGIREFRRSISGADKPARDESRARQPVAGQRDPMAGGIDSERRAN